jgi:hypothetical protein
MVEEMRAAPPFPSLPPVKKSYRIMGKQVKDGKRSQIHFPDFLPSSLKFLFVEEGSPNVSGQPLLGLQTRHSGLFLCD